MSEFDELIARVEAIEARQRAYGQHDPDCPYLASTRLWYNRDMGHFDDCTCWLADRSKAGS